MKAVSFEWRRAGRLKGMFAVSVADTFCARLFGLLGRNSDTQMMLLLTPCRAVHTFFMRRSIDLIFLDRAGKVLGVTSNLKPWRISWNFRAACVLECEPGFAWSTGLLHGDSLELSSAAGKLPGLAKK